MPEGEKFFFKKERTTKRKAVFEKMEMACPIDTFYIDKKSPLSDAEKLSITVTAMQPET